MALAKCLGACEINDGNGFASPSCTHNFETGGRGKGHPIYILNFRIPLRDILRFRVIAVYFADTGLKVSVCYEFLFELYFCKSTILETPRKLWPCLFATFRLTSHDDVMRRWSPDVDRTSRIPTVARIFEASFWRPLGTEA